MANPPLDARPDPQQVRALITQWKQAALGFSGDGEHIGAGVYQQCISDVEALLASSAPEPTKEPIDDGTAAD